MLPGQVKLKDVVAACSGVLHCVGSWVGYDWMMSFRMALSSSSMGLGTAPTMAVARRHHAATKIAKGNRFDKSEIRIGLNEM